MIKAEINFAVKRTKIELERVIQIKLKHGDVAIKCYDHDGPRIYTYRHGEIDYIRLGNQ